MPEIDSGALARGREAFERRAWKAAFEELRACDLAPVSRCWERNDSVAIEDLEGEGPKPAAEERIRARALASAGRRRQPRAVGARSSSPLTRVVSRGANVGYACLKQRPTEIL